MYLSSFVLVLNAVMVRMCSDRPSVHLSLTFPLHTLDAIPLLVISGSNMLAAVT
jgi:hypothetical protein